MARARFWCAIFRLDHRQCAVGRLGESRAAGVCRVDVLTLYEPEAHRVDADILRERMSMSTSPRPPAIAATICAKAEVCWMRPLPSVIRTRARCGRDGRRSRASVR